MLGVFNIYWMELEFLFGIVGGVGEEGGMVFRVLLRCLYEFDAYLRLGRYSLFFYLGSY